VLDVINRFDSTNVIVCDTVHI